MKSIHYTRKVHYYETDKMGIVHHSNYIRWMEEARVEFMDKMGFSYKRMETYNIGSPVLSISCEYKNMCHFDDIVDIEVYEKTYNGIKLVVGYIMSVVDENGNKTLCTEGESSHCFLNDVGKPIILKKTVPELDKVLKQWIND